MPNNLIVDVSSINATISKVNQLMNEASKPKYCVTQRGSGTGFQASPLHLSSSMKDFKIDAGVMNSNKASWTGWGSNIISRSYNFKNDFQLIPVVTATYDGRTNGVTVRIDVENDKLTVYLCQPKGSTWSSAGPGSDAFYVNFIAVGS